MYILHQNRQYLDIVYFDEGRWFCKICDRFIMFMYYIHLMQYRDRYGIDDKTDMQIIIGFNSICFESILSWTQWR